jgi:hypothetical protein
MLAVLPLCYKRGVEVELSPPKRVFSPKRISEEESYKKNVSRSLFLTLYNGAFLYTKGFLLFFGFVLFKMIGAFHT